jgi:hypothetical protein
MYILSSVIVAVLKKMIPRSARLFIVVIGVDPTKGTTSTGSPNVSVVPGSFILPLLSMDS